MDDQSSSPTLRKSIPSQVVNEGASFGPLNLNDFIQSPTEDDNPIRFRAELADGSPLPKGLICTPDGLLRGIPSSNTQGTYEVIITAEHDPGIPFTAQFQLTIKSRPVIETTEFIEIPKSQIWEALLKNIPMPELSEILERPITAVELYYLLQRFAVLTIWDVYNLDAPSEKTLLNLEGMNPYYNIYDRGSCIVGAPKDLFDHRRTLEDALHTARVMAREVYKRNWTIELSGFNKMIRAAWVELQIIGDRQGRHLDILRYDPSQEDMRIYSEKIKVMATLGM